tara:strand:- start:81 stop:713 length:633 start_codon:yes stop_codon:yes gene_type:complete
MTTPRLELLFPTPVVITKIKRHQEYKDRILPLITEKFKESPNQHAPWANMEHTWTSYSKEQGLNIWDEQFDELVHDYLNYLHNSPINFEIFVDSWLNVHDSNMYMEQHEHGGAICSGIYYLQLDPVKDYPATFMNPSEKEIENLNLKGVSFEAKCDALIGATYPNYLNIEEGDLILFPSYLTHFVKRSRTQHDKLRVSYAFNVENHTNLK